MGTLSVGLGALGERATVTLFVRSGCVRGRRGSLRSAGASLFRGHGDHDDLLHRGGPIDQFLLGELLLDSGEVGEDARHHEKGLLGLLRPARPAP